MSDVTKLLVWRYPQLSLPVEEGMSRDPRYTDIVRKGLLPVSPADPFLGSEKDVIITRDTPIGQVEVILLGHRQDFERFIQCIVHRCEPVPVPASMGADTIFGVTNRRKIEAHKKEFLKDNSPFMWGAEFKRFTADKANYCDNILVVSDGPYSAVPASDAGFCEEEWRKASLSIRTAHELTHLVCRRLWPEHKQAIRDEVLADAMGLWDAFGRYDVTLALRLIGIRNRELLPDGRLRNYVRDGESAEELVPMVTALSEELGQHLGRLSGKMFDCLRYLEENSIGL